jgi:transposase-like protein
VCDKRGDDIPVNYPLSLRNVEDLLAERGIDICHETVRHWWNRFGPDVRGGDQKEADPRYPLFLELAVGQQSSRNSHQPFRRRERAMLRFRSMKTLQKFSAIHASVQNHFNQERYLVSREKYKQDRSAALAEWRMLAA